MGKHDKKEIVRTHSFTEKSPVIAAVLFGFLALFVDQTISLGINKVISMLISSYPASDGVVGTIVGFAAVLAIYSWWFRPEFGGFISVNGLGRGLLIGLPMIVYLIASSLIGSSPASLRAPTVTAVSAAIAAGMLEELAYRGVLVSTLMRKWKNCGNKYVLIAVISGAAFGLIHLANLGAGADLSRTLNQVVGASFNGIFFAALFIRTGSIWPSVIYHMFNNVVAFVTSPDIGEDMMLSAPAGLANYLDTGLLFILAVYGIWLLRSSKHEEINSIWNEIWRCEGGDTK